MLDLGFVRANLELVEAKLRARGYSDTALDAFQQGFDSLDLPRREAITAAEQMKAELNELSRQVGALRKVEAKKESMYGLSLFSFAFQRWTRSMFAST